MVLIKIKRVYLPYSKQDGFRVLIDRLWPRGLTREKAHIDLWFKDIAPSNELRKWFSHDPSKFDEFKGRYSEEIDKQVLEKFIDLLKDKKVITLLYSAKDERNNNAVVLSEILKRRL